MCGAYFTAYVFGLSVLCGIVYFRNGYNFIVAGNQGDFGRGKDNRRSAFAKNNSFSCDVFGGILPEPVGDKAVFRLLRLFVRAGALGQI